MSVLLVRSSALCPKCIHFVHPIREECDDLSMRVFVEANDLCYDCMDISGSKKLFVRYPYPSEQAIVERVRRKSWFLRQERRRQFFREVTDQLSSPYFWMMISLAMVISAIGLTLAMGIWSWTQ